jgi:deoxyribose-phosphate aldolase
MAVTTPIDRSELEFNHGSFDADAFAAVALSSPQALAAVIDHVLLGPAVTRAQVETLCHEALRYRFASILVHPASVSISVGLLSGSGIPVGVALGFPFGASLVSTLRHEAATLCRLGARQFEMVVPLGQLKSGNHHAVHNAIHAVAPLVHHRGAILKVILETSMLTMQEKLLAAEIAIQAGADFIKTSTGFLGSGATAADIALLRGVAGARCGVSASGGIQSLAQVKAFLEAGANRIATDSSVSILGELGAE